jgi:hypothetical protein
MLGFCSKLVFALWGRAFEIRSETHRIDTAYGYARLARVRAALRAAADRLLRPLVCTARRAEADRSVRVRFRAAERACRESALRDAALRGSRFSARSVALERRRDGLGLAL